MSERNDGGPAFPQPITYMHERRDYPCEFGMGGISLRDYFAAKALQGLCANSKIRPSGGWDNFSADYARDAYAAADEMLRQREE